MCKSRLERTIEYLTENRRIFINICDVAGILKSVSDFSIPWELQINSCSFCSVAKSTQEGLSRCIEFKTESVNRCREDNSSYIRTCYLGITQYVYPVVWNDVTVCILYISNMVQENEAEKNKEHYKEYEKLTGISAKHLEDALNTTEITDNISKHFDAAYILRDVIIEILEKNNVKINTKNCIISGVLNYCNEFYASDITLEGVGALFYLNPDYLCRLFKKETGISFTQYLNHVRIDKAKKLLDKTDKKITEIAFEVGYTNDTYFIKKFKEICGVTPKQYQMRNK